MNSEMQPERKAPIQRITENRVYENRFITVYDDPVLFVGDVKGTYLRIVESGGRPGVAMLPIADGQVGLVRTYRYALGAWEWGIPRGFAHGTDPEESARAELAEEMGSEPQGLISLGQMSPNSGLLASVVHLFVARYSSPAATKPVDTFEIASIRWLPIADLRAEIATGRITDGFTLAAVCSAICRNVM